MRRFTIWFLATSLLTLHLALSWQMYKTLLAMEDAARAVEQSLPAIEKTVRSVDQSITITRKRFIAEDK